MRKTGKATIVDVAEKCGVSIKTVSRVINGSDKVSEKTKNKVNEAIKETGYQTNVLAKGLKGDRTNIIMVFIDRHEEEHLSSWHTLMLKYIFRYAKEKDLKVVVSPSTSKFENDETDGYYLLENGLADGAILLEHIEDDLRCKYLQKKNIPMVVFGEVKEKTLCTVSMDNYQAGMKGGNYLVGRGYRNICFFVGEKRFNSNQLRAEGFLESVKNCEGKFQVKYGVDTADKAYRIAKNILETEKPDAFFVSGDERAIGAFRAINEKGYSIPKDVAVLGIDNIPMSNYTYPRMSTIDQDFETLARECVELLDKQINGENIAERVKTTFLPSVIEREST